MVNTGKPSKGCVTCRRRKVKCDEGKPICQRCIKLELPCSYPDQWANTLRRQENWAKSKVIERLEKKARQETARRAPSNSPSSDCSSAYHTPAEVLLTAAPFTSPEVYTVNKFYTDFAFTSGTLPYLYLLPTLFDQPNGSQCLKDVLPAVALASSARQLRRHDLMTEAHKHYGQGLKALGIALSDPQEAKSDATLLAVFLIGLCEFITTDRLPGSTSPWHSHGPGRLALLRLRGQEQLHTKTGRNLFTLLYHEQLISSLLGNGQPLDEYPDWMCNSYPRTPGADVESTIHGISCLCSTLRRLCTSTQFKATKSERLKSLIRKGQEFDEALEAVELFRPTKAVWPVSDVIVKRARGIDRPRDLPPNMDLDDDLEKYTDITRAIVTNLYRAIRIHLLQTLLQALPLLPNDTLFDARALRLRWMEAIAAIAGKICDDVPVAWGERDRTGRPHAKQITGMVFRAYIMLWPLRTAAMADGVSEERRQMLVERLEWIGNVAGIGMALEVVESIKSRDHD